MSNNKKKAGWYLDARKAERLIPVIKHIRSMMIDSNVPFDLGGGLKAAKELADKARIGPTMLTAESFRWTPWIQTFADSGAKLYYQGTLKAGSVQAIREADRLTPIMQEKLEKASSKALITLARFYGVRGRGRMSSTELRRELPNRLAYSEAINQGIVDMLLREAGLLVDRGEG